MRTPGGAECALYYQDFHRGRDLRECRVKRARDSRAWRPEDCSSCPVPAILLANGSPYLDLTLAAPAGRWRRRGKVRVDAWCSLHAVPVADPHVGCPECADDMGVR